MESKNLLLLGILPLDESDEEYEIKNFYNTHLTPYSYDDFLNLDRLFTTLEPKKVSPSSKVGS